MKRGKRYLEVAKLVDRNKLYSLEEASELVKKTATAKFDETVDLAVRLNVDRRQADQNFRGTVSLPYGTGKQVRVLVFAEGEQAREAQEAGADYVGGQDLVDKIQEGWLEFDAVVATPQMMPIVGRLGRILGPLRLMPSPRAGTVTPDVASAVREIKAGRVEFKLEPRAPIIHIAVGKVSFSPQQIQENVATIMDAIVRARPASVRGRYVQSVVLSATMGPGIKLDPQQFAKSAA